MFLLLVHFQLHTEKYETDMARNIHAILFDRAAQLDNLSVRTYVFLSMDGLFSSPARDFFMKGRNTYAMKVKGDAESILYDIPNTIVHSKEDCMRLGTANAMAIPSQTVLDLLKQSMKHAGTESSRKKKRKERQEVKAVDEDLDMFSDWCVCWSKGSGGRVWFYFS